MGKNSAELSLPPVAGELGESVRGKTELAKSARERAKRWGNWKSGATDFAVGALLPAALLLGWQWAADRGAVSSLFLPSPMAIALEFRTLAEDGELFRHLGMSVWRALVGFLIGGGLGLLFGLVAGFSRKAEYILDPSMQMLRLVPHLAVAPLILLWFGFGEWSKVLIIAQGAFFPLYVNTFMGIRNVDGKLFEVAKLLAFSRWNLIVRLVLPAALPSILLGLRLSLALSWIGLVVAELIGSQSGIGFLINVGRQTNATEDIFVGVIVFAVVGKLVDSFVRLLERKTLHWRENFEG